MHYIVFDDMSQCTEADVQRLLSVMPPWRCQQAMKFHHLFGQWTCLKAWELLGSMTSPARQVRPSVDRREVLVNFSTRKEPPMYNEFGKPFYPDAPHFSISHCKTAVAVAIDSQPVGIDVESLRHVEQALIERTMNLQEQALIAAADDPVRAFTRLWTQKEAILKYYGTGIIDDLHSVLNNVPKNVKIDTFDHADYVLSVALQVRV